MKNSKNRSLCILIFFIFAATSLTAKTLTIGVFAYQAPEKIIQEYQPIADHLSKKLNTTVIVKPLDQSQLEQQVSKGLIDIVATNPTHYLSLQKKGKTTGAIVTLVKRNGNLFSSMLGGVIIVRADRTDIKNMKDLIGKTVAIPGEKFLGGYQTQAYELLKNSINVEKDLITKVTGSHSKVVDAVISGSADAGFIRSGIIEELAEDHKLNPKALFVINEQSFSHFPLKVSTSLYPEWAIVAARKLDVQTVSKIAVALYEYENFQTGNNIINGFSIPGDYAEIDALARKLRIAPYEKAPDFTSEDIWNQYRLQIIIALFSSVVFFFLMIRLFRMKQLLENQFKKERQFNETLQRAESVAKIGNWSLDLKTNTLQWSDEVFRIFEIDKEKFEASYEQFLNAIHPEDRDAVNEAYANSLMRKEKYDITHRLLMKDGRVKYVIEQGESDFNKDGTPMRSIGTIQDVTQQQQAIRKNTYLLEIIDQYVMYIRVDKNGIILEASNSFCEKSGCIFEHIVGKNINIFKSNRTPRSLYERLWETIQTGQTFRCEIENNNFKEGTSWYHATISATYDESNQHTGYIAFYENIDDKVMYKKSSETDILTGLPNRYRLDRELALEVERSLRYKEPFSVILVDIDYFKEVNDNYGHQIGDLVLQEFAQILSNNIRATDIVGRWGGEEFLIVCSQTNADGALALAENLRKIIENFSFNTVAHKTASFGVTSYCENISTNLLFKNVDDALYRAKESGRNKVVALDC